MEIYTSIESALNDLGETLQGHESQSLGGGCINSCYSLALSSGRRVFIKKNSASLLNMFQAEALGLEELAEKKGPPVPEVLALGTQGSQSFLMLSYVEKGVRKKDYWQELGRNLAQLHRSEGGVTYGWEQDNYIGSTPQINTPMNRWIDFFGERRLRFQGELARKGGYLSNKEMKLLESLIDKLGCFLYEPERPEFIHGDLWSGNSMTGFDGRGWIIDPAVYWGHGEADLAMTEMFGGYHSLFYGAYREIYGEEPGYSDRRDIYNLYHYLNHLNLFGGGYYSSALSIIQRYG